MVGLVSPTMQEVALLVVPVVMVATMVMVVLVALVVMAR